MTAIPFQETVVELTRQIDNLLFKLGGSGRNFGERASSLGHVLNAEEARRLRLVAKVNRKMIYHGGLTIRRDHHRFIRTCGWMIYRLETLLTTRGQRQVRRLRRTNAWIYRGIPIGAGTLGLLVAVVLCMHTSRHVGWTLKLITNTSNILCFAALLGLAWLTTRLVAKRR